MKAVHKRIQLSKEAIRPRNAGPFLVDPLDTFELETRLNTRLEKLYSKTYTTQLTQHELCIERAAIREQLKVLHGEKLLTNSIEGYFLQVAKESLSFDKIQEFMIKAEKRRYYWSKQQDIFKGRKCK